MLIAGAAGAGKMRLALELAQALNCETGGEPCGDCRQCSRIAASKHADVRVIGAPGQAVKIEEMRELQQDAALVPFEGRNRVFIIDGAERMTGEAANCLLKTLEEPPDNVYLLLLTLAARGTPLHGALAVPARRAAARRPRTDRGDADGGRRRRRDRPHHRAARGGTRGMGRRGHRRPFSPRSPARAARRRHRGGRAWTTAPGSSARRRSRQTTTGRGEMFKAPIGTPARLPTRVRAINDKRQRNKPGPPPRIWRPSSIGSACCAAGGATCCSTRAGGATWPSTPTGPAPLRPSRRPAP